MAANVIEVANDVVLQMNAGTFTTGIVWAQRFWPRATLESLSTIQGRVVPQNDAGNRVSRSQWEHLYTLELGIRKRIAAGVTEAAEEVEMNTLVNASQEVIDFWKSRHAHSEKCHLESFDYPELLSETAINEQKLILVRFTLTFKGWR